MDKPKRFIWRNVATLCWQIRLVLARHLEILDIKINRTFLSSFNIIYRLIKINSWKLSLINSHLPFFLLLLNPTSSSFPILLHFNSSNLRSIFPIEIIFSKSTILFFPFPTIILRNTQKQRSNCIKITARLNHVVRNKRDGTTDEFLAKHFTSAKWRLKGEARL